MYLSKKIYLGSQYEHNKIVAKIDITSHEKPVKINTGKIVYIIESAIYWRKVNHIHSWFVNNCQNGEDECQETEISKEQLKNLLSTCKKVLEDNSLAEELLPTSEGFFFGSTNYDTNYFESIKDTVEELEPLIEEWEQDTNHLISYTYQASW